MSSTLERGALDGLFEALSRRGYTVIGPAVRDGAIVYDELASSADLPAGWTDEQDGGHYRLRRREDEALFGYAVGPHSWKGRRLPPQRRLWRARLGDDGGLIEPELPDEAPQRLAFLGARSCELHAMGILDRVLGGPGPDDVFVVAVQCGQAGGTCFCVSMGTGPTAEAGFDLALTELCEPGAHRFVVEVGSVRGAEVLHEVEHRDAAEDEEAGAAAAHARAAAQMGREIETEGLRELLYRNLEHPRWDDVAARCLSCGNCTMVCPTCFCTTVEDVTDLAGEHVERHERWDSCFTVDHSHLHGGAVRNTPRSRYRQWMTHKLATWVDQFGTSGCVGCGRCITWCPVGIDLTEEARAIRATDGAGRADA
jgi:sulfhydrogenase subunit beta (sulfur reductase)